MADYELLVEPRTLMGKKVKYLRAQGYVPAVLYGRGITPMNLQCQARNLSLAVKGAGADRIITIQIGQDGEPQRVQIKDLQYEPVYKTIEHADFLRVGRE